jgi:hypothetical protein
MHSSSVSVPWLSPGWPAAWAELIPPQSSQTHSTRATPSNHTQTIFKAGSKFSFVKPTLAAASNMNPAETGGRWLRRGANAKRNTPRSTELPEHPPKTTLACLLH